MGFVGYSMAPSSPINGTGMVQRIHSMPEDNKPRFNPVSLDELASFSIDPKLSAEAKAKLAKPIIPIDQDLEARWGTFSLKRFSLFAVPSVAVYLQGPTKGLPPLKELDTNFRQYFSEGLVKLRTNYPSNETITPDMAAIIKELTDGGVAKLYNDRDWHLDFIRRLVDTGLSINEELTLSRTNVIHTIKTYHEGFAYWLGKHGFGSIEDWELRDSMRTKGGKKVTRASMQRLLEKRDAGKIDF